MSLPTYKPTDSSINSGLSPDEKLKISGVIPDIISKAKNIKFPELPSLSSSSSSSSIFTSPFNSDSNDADEETSYFSFTFLFRLILIIVIGWFMWVNLANNSEFNLGMGSFGEKISGFFHSMEENGRVLYARITGNTADYKSLSSSDNDQKHAEEDEDEDEDEEDTKTIDDKTPNTETGSIQHIIPPTQWHADSINRNIPVPPPTTNSADKKPGFLNEDTKYTFLDKANRNYSGPSPLPDDSTSKTQKHQSGKAGYCYIGEDRGFRSCIKVEAGDTCMSGDVYSRKDICMNPSLRE
jgi:hypothetical protein